MHGARVGEGKSGRYNSSLRLRLAFHFSSVFEKPFLSRVHPLLHHEIAAYGSSFFIRERKGVS